MAGQRQLLRQRPLEAGVRPPLESGSPGLLLRLGPAHGELAVARPVSARSDVRVDELAVWRGADEPVPETRRELGGLGRRGRHDHVDRIARKRVDACVLDAIVLPLEAAGLAAPEQSHDLDGLFEHLEPLAGGGPAVAEDMLVEVLARPHTEEESPRHHVGGRRRRLGHDCGVDPDRRTGDAGPEPQLVRRGGDAADHAPDERALPLPLDPGMEVVGDQCEREAVLLRAPRMAEEVERAMLLAREGVAEFHRTGSVPWPADP